MKSIKYILITLLLFPLLAGLSSCMEEEIDKSEIGDGKTLQLVISSPALDVISPLTKSKLDEVDAIHNMCILIYQDGKLLADESKYYSDKAESGSAGSLGLSEIQNGKEQRYTLSVEGGSKTFYVITNAGNLINSGTMDKEADLKKASFQLDKNGNPQYVSFAQGKTFDTSSTAGDIPAVLKRLYAMISVVVENKTTGSPETVIIPTKVTLHNVPTSCTVMDGNLIPSNPDYSNFRELATDAITSFATPDNKTFGSHETKELLLFMYENKQPDGFCTNENGEKNQAWKTPKSIGKATKDPNTVEKDKTCSYIQVETQYQRGQSSGSVSYRFFLGKNELDNFEVMRNTHYQVTLTLSGDAGLAEASWRVTTKVSPYFTVHDAYIGYRQGASSRIYVDIDDEMADASKWKWTFTKTNGDEFLKSIPTTLTKDENGKWYFPIDAVETNVSDRTDRVSAYKLKIAPVSTGNTHEMSLKVTQVRRIQEPIGFYRDYGKGYTDHVLVKEYDKALYKYVDLQSVGEWTAEIEYGGDWFTISRSDNTDDYVSIVSTGSKLKGISGAIKFDYQPANVGNTSMVPRYGSILVKYHNTRCEHRIFVRQGYGDTEIGGTYWTAKNVKASGEFVEYPTMSGPLFQGGTGSYNRDGSLTVKTFSPYEPIYNTSGIAGWESGSGASGGKSNWDYTESDPKRGPCPKGYHVPHVKAYSYIRQQCYLGNIQAYIGYVHDDSDVNATFEMPLGWEWVSGGVKRTGSGQYDCNPAKGTILVTDDGKNIFFPFGKGILDHDKTDYKNIRTDRDFNVPQKFNNYETTINEIGIGRRQDIGRLKFTDGDTEPGIDLHVYGATYWSGSPTIGTWLSNHMLYCRFWSLLKRNLPFYVSDGSHALTGENYEGGYVLYQNNTRGPIGEDRLVNASFVRCVTNASRAYTHGTNYNK